MIIFIDVFYILSRKITNSNSYQIGSQFIFSMSEIQEIFQLYSCKICERDYSKDHIPTIVCENSHIICKPCYNQIWPKNCPFCKKSTFRIAADFRQIFQVQKATKRIIQKERQCQNQILDLTFRVQKMATENQQLSKQKLEREIEGIYEQQLNQVIPFSIKLQQLPKVECALETKIGFLMQKLNQGIHALNRRAQFVQKKKRVEGEIGGQIKERILQLELLRKKAQELNSEILKCHNQIENLNKNLKTSETIIYRLLQQKQSAINQSNKAKDESLKDQACLDYFKKQFDQQTLAYEDNLRKFNEKSEQQDRRIQIWIDKYNEIKMQKYQLLEEISKLKAKIEQQSQNTIKLQEQKQRNRAEIQMLKEKAEKTAIEVNRIIQEKSAFRSEKQKITNQLFHGSHDFNQAQKQIEGNKKLIFSLQAEKAKLIEQNRSLIQKSEAIKKECQLKFEEAKVQVAKSKQKQGNLLAQKLALLLSLTGTQLQFKNTIETQRTASKELRIEIKLLKQSIENQKKSRQQQRLLLLQQYQKKQVSFTSTIDQLKHSNSSLNDQIVQIRQQKERIAQQLTESKPNYKDMIYGIQNTLRDQFKAFTQQKYESSVGMTKITSTIVDRLDECKKQIGDIAQNHKQIKTQISKCLEATHQIKQIQEGRIRARSVHATRKKHEPVSTALKSFESATQRNNQQLSRLYYKKCFNENVNNQNLCQKDFANLLEGHKGVSKFVDFIESSCESRADEHEFLKKSKKQPKNQRSVVQIIQMQREKIKQTQK